MSYPDAATTVVVLRPSERPVHDRGGGVSTIPLVTPAVGARGLLNGITQFAPGAAVAFHSHDCEESVMLLEGEGVLEVDGRAIPLRPYDTTWIPAHVPHRFRNLSPAQPMRILWIYARVDATRTLIATGESRAIVSEHGS